MRLLFTRLFFRITLFVSLGFLLSGCMDRPPSVTVSFTHIDSNTIFIQNVAVFDSRSLQTNTNMD